MKSHIHLRNLLKITFKRKLRQCFVNISGLQDFYTDLSKVKQNVKSL